MILLAVILAFVSPANTPPAGTSPPSPYIDAGACPFECCTYRDWRAEQDLPMFDRPNGIKQATLDKGEWVHALTGEVDSIPLRIVASRDVPEAGIHPGDIFWILDYQGEFYWKIWFHGKTFSAESGDSRAPDSTWWAKVKRKDGTLGWVVAQGEAFSNQDQCGGPN